MKLLHFMERRWKLQFSDEQMKKLISVNFVLEPRSIPDPQPIPTSEAAFETEPDDLNTQQLQFWSRFVEHCNVVGRSELVSRKPCAQNWCDTTVSTNDFHLSFTVTYGKYISLLIYVYNAEAFKRLENHKSAIETSFGHRLDWYSSHEKSTAKRIIYKHEADVFNTDRQPEIFDWMIRKLDFLSTALVDAGVLAL